MVTCYSDDLQTTSVHGAAGSPDTPSSYGKHWARGETRKRCFPEQTRIGAELRFPRRVALSQMKLPEPSFAPFLRWALAGSLPTCRKVRWWGPCTQGLFRPHHLSPERRARLELVSSSSDHQQSTSAQAAGGSPYPTCPMASNGLGEKPESAVFLSKHALGLSLVSRREFHFRECSCQKLVFCLF